MGHGKELRLFRVDRWDSGLYFCSSNATKKTRQQVELRVDSPPKVSAPGAVAGRNLDFEPGIVSLVEVRIGEPAVLKCKVNR